MRDWGWKIIVDKENNMSKECLWIIDNIYKVVNVMFGI